MRESVTLTKRKEERPIPSQFSSTNYPCVTIAAYVCRDKNVQYGLNNEVFDFNHDFTVHYSIYNSELRDFGSHSNECQIRLFSRSVTVPGSLASQQFFFTNLAALRWIPQCRDSV